MRSGDLPRREVLDDSELGDVAAYIALYAMLYSWLASQSAKRRARRLLGPGTDRWYCLAYNPVAVAALLPLALLMLWPRGVRARLSWVLPTPSG